MIIKRVWYLLALLCLIYISSAVKVYYHKKIPFLTMTNNRFHTLTYILVSNKYGKPANIEKFIRQRGKELESRSHSLPSTGVVQQTSLKNNCEDSTQMLNELPIQDENYLDQIVSVSYEQNQFENNDKILKMVQYGKFGFNLGPQDFNKKIIDSSKTASIEIGSECQSARILDQT